MKMKMGQKMFDLVSILNKLISPDDLLARPGCRPLLPVQTEPEESQSSGGFIFLTFVMSRQ